MSTSYLCKFLEQKGISDDVLAVFRKEKISGETFPALTEEDLRKMGLAMGDMKLILKLQAKDMPKTKQVSYDHNYILATYMHTHNIAYQTIQNIHNNTIFRQIQNCYNYIRIN